MAVRVPIIDIYGVATPYFLEIERRGDEANLRIDGSFAGRDVDEDMPLDALRSLAGDSSFSFRELLGLSLETDGSMVKGLIGVGSGNEGFVLAKNALARALDQLS